MFIAGLGILALERNGRQTSNISQIMSTPVCLVTETVAVGAIVRFQSSVSFSLLKLDLYL